MTRRGWQSLRLAILLVSVTGCTSVAGIRASTPTMTGILPGTYDVAGRCVLRSLETDRDVGDLMYRFIEDPRAHSSMILASIEGIGFMPLFEISLIQQGGGVGVEVRQAPSIASVWSRRAWKAVDRCRRL
jgi:hypothetical protein